MLRLEANKEAAKDGYPEFYDDLASDGACKKFDIPVRWFAGPASRDVRAKEPLPPELVHLVDVKGIGHITEWGGKKVVVVENGLPDFICVAPAERIALDC